MKRITFAILTLLLMAITPISAQQYKEDYVVKRTKSGAVVDTAGPRVEMINGVMTGVNIPIMRDKHHDVKSDGSAGFMLGFRWGVDLGGFEIVPEFWYMHDKMTLSNSKYNNSGDLKSNSFELPIVFGMGIGEKFRFNFGPSFALASGAELEYDDDVIEFGSYKSTFGYVVGMSYTAWEHWVLDVRYSGRFVSSETEWPGLDESYDYRYYSVSITMGYRF